MTQVRPAEVGFVQRGGKAIGLLKGSPIEIGGAEIRAGQIGARKIRMLAASAAHANARHPGAAEGSLRELRVRKVGPLKRRGGQVRPREVDASKLRSGEISADQTGVEEEALPVRVSAKKFHGVHHTSLSPGIDLSSIASKDRL